MASLKIEPQVTIFPHAAVVHVVETSLDSASSLRREKAATIHNENGIYFAAR